MPRVPSINCRSVTRSRSFAKIVPREQRVAFDDDQDVIFARGEPFRHILILMELRRVRTEELAERIIDLDAADSEGGENGGDRQDGSDEIGKAQGDEADALDPVSQRMQFAPRAGRGWLLQERVQIFV